MSTIGSWNYGDALRALWARSSYERGYITNPFGDAASGERGLRRVATLLGRLGRPQERLATVHVAGSKGKGSTCALIEASLRAAGHRVGLYTSPHLHSFRERIAVGGDAITEGAFTRLTRRVETAATRLEAEFPELGQVTTFELLTAMALDHFAALGCTIAVVEVGLGGTYDATNVLTPLVAAITRLDLEHVAVLGPTIEAIAAAKAGIIKPGRPVVVSPQPAAATAVIETVARDRQAPLLLGGRDWTWSGSWRAFDATGPWGEYRGLRLALPGAHQVENACTALAALWHCGNAGIEVPETATREGLVGARWPGRFERIALPNGPTVVLDGAHTPVAAAALAAVLADEYPGRQAVVVLGTLADKDAATIAAALAPIASGVIATRSRHPRSATAAVVADGVRAAGVAVDVVPEIGAAVTTAIGRAARSDLIVVTGSLSVVAEAKEALGLASADPEFR